MAEKEGATKQTTAWPVHPLLQRPPKQGWKNLRHGTFTGGHRTHPTCCFPVVAPRSARLTRGATAPFNRIGIALADSIDELLREEAITPQLAQTIMVQVSISGWTRDLED